jgi:hypothetical protein
MSGLSSESAGMIICDGSAPRDIAYLSAAMFSDRAASLARSWSWNWEDWAAAVSNASISS